MLWLTILIAVFSVLYILLAALLYERIHNIALFKAGVKGLMLAWIANIVTYLGVDIMQMAGFFWFYRIVVSIMYLSALIFLSSSVYNVINSFLSEVKR